MQCLTPCKLPDAGWLCMVFQLGKVAQPRFFREKTIFSKSRATSAAVRFKLATVISKSLVFRIPCQKALIFRSGIRHQP